MPRYFLTRLKVEGFRGINNQGNPLDISFKPDAVNSVFAVNGIGKSSIFDSLYYVVHGTIPKLEDLKTHERPQEYYCNRFHSGNNAIIELEPDDGTNPVSILVKRDAAGNRTVSSPSGHADPEVFLNRLKEAFALLDYRTFSRFIDESPLERGRTFSALLGLSQYSDYRQALQAVSDTRAINTDLDMKVLETQIFGIQRTSQQALAALRTNFEKLTGRTLEDVEKLDQYSAEVLQALGNIELLSEHIKDKALDDIDFDSIKDTIKTAEGGEKRKELETTIADISALESLGGHNSVVISEEQEKVESLISERDALLSATRGDLFEKLYSAARDVVDSDSWSNDTQCPLCESDLENSISAHIKQQLNQYTDTAAKTKELNELWSGSAWKQCLSDLEVSKVLGVAVADRILARLDTQMRTGELDAAESIAAAKRTSELKELVSDLLKKTQEKKASLEAELPASLVQLAEQVQYGRQFKEALESYKRSQAEETEKQAQLNIRERWKTFISKVSTQFSNAEAVLSKGKISEIDAEYKSMYKDIMQVGDVVPDLQRADEKEDLNVELSNFHGQHRLSARALLSESYRNAIAISVFLAAAMKHSGAPRFVDFPDFTRDLKAS